MNESGWWSFLYFMGAGQERDWGESKVSQARNKPTPCQLGKARGRRCKTPPPAGKAVGGQEKTPCQLEKKAVGGQEKTPCQVEKKAVGGQEKPPDSRCKDGAGSRSVRARAKPKNNAQQRNKIISSPKEASASPPRGLKNTHTAKQKRC